MFIKFLKLFSAWHQLLLVPLSMLKIKFDKSLATKKIENKKDYRRIILNFFLFGKMVWNIKKRIKKLKNRYIASRWQSFSEYHCKPWIVDVTKSPPYTESKMTALAISCELASQRSVGLRYIADQATGRNLEKCLCHARYLTCPSASARLSLPPGRSVPTLRSLTAK